EQPQAEVESVVVALEPRRLHEREGGSHAGRAAEPLDDHGLPRRQELHLEARAAGVHHEDLRLAAVRRCCGQPRHAAPSSEPKSCTSLGTKPSASAATKCTSTPFSSRRMPSCSPCTWPNTSASGLASAISSVKPLGSS